MNAEFRGADADAVDAYRDAVAALLAFHACPAF